MADICTHDDIITVIQNEIIGLDLYAIGGRVFAVRWPDQKQVDFPCVFVSVEGETEQADERVNVGTDWGYPTRVFLADNDTTNARANLTRELTWRQQIIDRFHMQQFAADPLVYQFKVVPAVIYDPRLPQYEHVVSGMVIWAKVRVVRGTRPHGANVIRTYGNAAMNYGQAGFCFGSF